VKQHKATYIGVGIGIALFFVIGLLPGSFIGGVVGLHSAIMLFGSPLEGNLVSRLLVALGMMMGVFISAVGFSTIFGVLGYIVDMIINLKIVTIDLHRVKGEEAK